MESIGGLRSRDCSSGRLAISRKEGTASALDDAVVARARDTGSVSVVRSSDGTAVVHDVTFAFVAHDFHSETEIEAGDN